MPEQFDAIVIGSGQAGNPLAHKLADKGWRVALIEKEHLGGTCINTGCTPTKMLVHRAQVAHYARNGAKWGVTTEGVRVNFPEIIAAKNKLVESFRNGQENNVKKRPALTLYRGQARFTGPRQVQVNGETLDGKHIFINAGTRPAIPRINGLEAAGYLTNASVMQLQEVPEHLVVLGGGYIGLEFGQMFRRFGARVTVVHHGAQLLPREDADVIGEMQKALEAEGMTFLLNAATRKIEKSNGQVLLTVDMPGGPTTVRGSHFLVAAGRTPNTDTLDLDKAGIETVQGGFIKVNNRLETNVPGVWALGDIKGGPAFTHISYNDYQIVWANLMEGGNLTTDNRYVPYAVFTDPQLGGIGMTEKAARAAGRKLKIGKIPMSYVARAIERDETAGLMKIIVDAETDKILGASILATEGGELVQMLGAVMMAGAPYTLLKGAVYTHPTLAEGFWTLMESVKPVDG
jgi:pyruvate/2-oxoglutarate dehydrogenase complex dihydrolipoamide dehydrogenase (E3) component